MLQNNLLFIKKRIYSSSVNLVCLKKDFECSFFSSLVLLANCPFNCPEASYVYMVPPMAAHPRAIFPNEWAINDKQCKQQEGLSRRIFTSNTSQETCSATTNGSINSIIFLTNVFCYTFTESEDTTHGGYKHD